MWNSFVGWADIFIRDGLHLSAKGAAVFVGELSATVHSGMGSVKDIFGSKHCLNTKCGGGYLEVPQTGQEATSTHKPVTKCPENNSEAGCKCMCLNAKDIVNNINELSIMVDNIDPHINGISDS